MIRSNRDAEYFRMGRQAALAEVREYMADGVWSASIRACLLTDAEKASAHLRQKYPDMAETISYYRGYTAFLKSRLSMAYSKSTQKPFPSLSPSFDTEGRITGNTVYCPLLREDITGCSHLDCGEIATWKCYPPDPLAPSVALCDWCKQEVSNQEDLEDRTVRDFERSMQERDRDDERLPVLEIATAFIVCFVTLPSQLFLESLCLMAWLFLLKIIHDHVQRLLHWQRNTRFQ